MFWFYIKGTLVYLLIKLRMPFPFREGKTKPFPRKYNISQWPLDTMIQNCKIRKCMKKISHGVAMIVRRENLLERRRGCARNRLGLFLRVSLQFWVFIFSIHLGKYIANKHIGVF